MHKIPSNEYDIVQASLYKYHKNTNTLLQIIKIEMEKEKKSLSTWTIGGSRFRT